MKLKINLYMQCFCLEPVIIKNHVERYKVNHKDWTFVLRGAVVYTVPSPRKARIQLSDLDDCYYYNIHSGEIVPMYIQVPCGKCLICGDKKAKDWACRMYAEQNYHSNQPWWITLTFNDLALPDDRSINKRHVQLFLKRLRERTSRVIGSDVRLRYVCTGEYGGNFGRPHYHLMLFGMPTISLTKCLRLLEESWSMRVSKKVYSDLPQDFRFMRYSVNQKPLYYQRIGFVKVKPAHDNVPMYLAKYMFKPEFNTPFGCTPNFNLSSRKNGIGYSYVEEFRDFHRRNPNITQIAIQNKWTGTIKEFGFPRYYKDYIFPSISKVLPSDVKKSLDDMRNLVGSFLYVTTQMDRFDLVHHDDVPLLCSDISRKYSFLPDVELKPIDFSGDLKFLHLDYRKYYVGNSTPYQDFLSDVYRWLYKQIYLLYDFLLNVDFDTQVFESTLKLRDIFKMHNAIYLESQPPIDLKAVKDRILRRWYKMKRQDMY